MAERSTYYISFDTKEYAPFLKGTYVTLGSELIRDLNKQLPISLSDHPLYPQLVRYVLANPVKESKEPA